MAGRGRRTTRRQPWRLRARACRASLQPSCLSNHRRWARSVLRQDGGGMRGEGRVGREVLSGDGLGLPRGGRLAAPGGPRLVEDHEQRGEALRVDQAEDLDVGARPLAPAGDLAGRAPPWRTGRGCGSAGRRADAPPWSGPGPSPRTTSCGSRSGRCRCSATPRASGVRARFSAAATMRSKSASWPAHQLQIAQHAGQLVHGQRPGGLVLVARDRSCRGSGSRDRTPCCGARNAAAPIRDRRRRGQSPCRSPR